MKAKSRAKAPDLGEIRDVLREFWGYSNGSQEAFDAMRAKLIEARLSGAQLDELIDALPSPPGGPTADRVKRVRDLLERVKGVS